MPSPKREARRAAREAQWADQWQDDADEATIDAEFEPTYLADVPQNGADLNMSGDGAPRGRPNVEVRRL